MSSLIVLSDKELCKILMKLGYEIDHQTGSHLILRQNIYPNRRLTVPNHKEIANGDFAKDYQKCPKLSFPCKRESTARADL